MSDLPGPTRPAFAAVLLPAAGRVTVACVGLAEEYCDYTPGKGARLGWPRPTKWVDTVAGQSLAWCGERRLVWELPDNPAALVLATQLGAAGLAERIGLRGDLLLAGVDAAGAPADVPDAVVHAAALAGLLASGRGRAVSAGYRA